MKRKKRLAILARKVAPGLGCSPGAALAALERLEKAGLVAVRRGVVVLPLAPIARDGGRHG